MSLSSRHETAPCGWPRLESLVAARLRSALAGSVPDSGSASRNSAAASSGNGPATDASPLFLLASPAFRLDAGSAALTLAPAAAFSAAPSQTATGPGSKALHAAAKIGHFLLALFLGIHFFYIVSTSLLIIAYRYVNPSATVLMAYRAWVDHWKLERPRSISLKNTPRYVRRMLISVEDGNFYEHHGIDIEAIKRAYEINKKLGKPLYGGSTLSMQMARTLFLVPEKSYVRKYFELIATFELELFLPKDRILELYFNYAEWGKGIFGIQTAAWHYYGRGLSDLSRSETAKLIALLSSPVKYTPATLLRKPILRERYYYLIGKYTTPPPTTAEPDTDSSLENAVPAEEGSVPADAPGPEPAVENTAQPGDSEQGGGASANPAASENGGAADLNGAQEAGGQNSAAPGTSQDIPSDQSGTPR